MDKLIMKRRDFVRSSVLTLGGAALSRSLPALALESTKHDPSVKRVLAVFKCHFDAGFVDTQANVIHRYFNEFFPLAITIAEESRKPGGQRYVWTTGSWLLYEYLEQASTTDRARMETAIANGDIAWHALPFSWQTEMLNQSMVAASVQLSKSLDQRYGRTTTGAKMSDVPGHTRGIIAPLASQGVTLLDIGVNHGSTTPDLPPVFVWKDSRGALMVVILHPDYGGVVRVPGSDVAVAVCVRGDNKGPHPAEEIADIYDDLHRQFPNAEIVATNMSEIANQVVPYQSNFPVVTQEIGDTWIYGISSDPLKLARYREIVRLRSAWIKQGKLKSADTTDVALLRSLLLETEHTWGADTKSWLDFDHYTPQDLSLMLFSNNYKVVQSSWNEKRQDLIDAIATLPQTMHEEARAAIHGCKAIEPELAGGTIHAASEAIETTHFVIAIDPQTGAITRLKNKQTGIEWADADHPVALFTYQTLSKDDYTRYNAEYNVKPTLGIRMDFSKPRIEHFGAKRQEWKARLKKIEGTKDSSADRILIHLELIDPDAVSAGRVAFPQRLYLLLTLPMDEPVIHLEFSWFEKQPTRMPESMWLTFHPIVSDVKGWSLDKTGERISPFDVVEGGGRQMHAVETGFEHRDGERVFKVDCVDAPVIAFGEMSPLNYSRKQADLSGGVHSNLFNNAWGTNYLMWFGEDMRFRYTIHA